MNPILKALLLSVGGAVCIAAAQRIMREEAEEYGLNVGWNAGRAFERKRLLENAAGETPKQP